MNLEAPSLCLRSDGGELVAADGWRWLCPAGSEEEHVLDRAEPPVLDIGCGPGRHLLALAARGAEGLGLDVTAAAVELARSRGAQVVEGSIFGPVPVLVPGAPPCCSTATSASVATRSPC